MDAMQNESANAQAPQEQERELQHGADEQQAGTVETAPSGQDGQAESAEQAAEQAEADATEKTADPERSAAAAESTAAVAEVPQPRSAESDSGSGKGKKRKAAPKSKSAAGTKSLVVFRDGKVHYSDESVVVLDLDEAAHPDTDVHDVVDKLSELRDATESTGRTEAVTLVAELIQAKALA